MTTTKSKDPIIKLMVEGAKPGKRCQWQELYFIGHAVVRIDKVMVYQDLARINWNDIYNTLVRSWYVVFRTQSIVKPEDAIDPTAELSDNWTYATVYENSFPITVAYREIGMSGFYEVSFVMFTRWKTNLLARAVKSLV